MSGRGVRLLSFISQTSHKAPLTPCTGTRPPAIHPTHPPQPRGRDRVSSSGHLLLLSCLSGSALLPACDTEDEGNSIDGVVAAAAAATVGVSGNSPCVGWGETTACSVEKLGDGRGAGAHLAAPFFVMPPLSLPALPGECLVGCVLLVWANDCVGD